MILHIPVRRKIVRLNGVDESVLELANGFVSVTTDSPPVGAESMDLQISNPLAEAFMDLFNRGFVGATERVQIKLVELPHSNPGENEDGTSINHLDVIV